MRAALSAYVCDQPSQTISEAIRGLLQEVLRDKGYLPK
jgi:hypothetical protein